MRRLSKLLSITLFAVVVAMLAFSLISNFLVVAQGFFAPFSIVSGNSMSPALQNNDAVVITAFNQDQLSVGDVVLFSDPDNPHKEIVHRIVAFQEDDGSLYAVTKGDANPVADPFLTPISRIQGKVSVTIPKLGIFLSFVRTPPGFIICIFCPLGLMVLYLLMRYYLEQNEPEKGVLAKELIHSN
jgi:signal peptidase